jgi:hypothetical protein
LDSLELNIICDAISSMRMSGLLLATPLLANSDDGSASPLVSICKPIWARLAYWDLD